jgi:hypothetical protein
MINLGLMRRAKVATAAVTVVSLGSFVVPAAGVHVESAAPGTSANTTAATQRAAAAPGTLTSRVRGTFGRDGTVRGTFVPERFFVRGGDAYANGVLRTTLRRGNGELVGRSTRQVTIPVRNGSTSARSAQVASSAAAQGGACDILNLVLGPLDLDLLGLEVHLNRVVLDIVARAGAGNLLGNLLCAVAGLLDGTGLLNELRLANVLNRVLALLRL